MSNLFTQQGVDFDTWFGLGTGDRELNIVDDTGQDIGYKYAAGSGGPEVAWHAPDGRDLNQYFAGYGYGLYRVGGYPWNYYHSNFDWSTHYNYWKNWLSQWQTKKYSCKCVSNIWDDCWHRAVDSDYNYSCCIFGYAPNHNAINFNYWKPNVWSNCGKHKEVTLGLIEISSYLKGVVIRPIVGAGDDILAEVRVNMSSAGSPTVDYDGVYGIDNDDNHDAVAYYGDNRWIFGKQWYFHI